MSIELNERVSTNGASPSQRLHPMLILLFGLFFLSGFSALAYQTAWQRMLGAFAGSDSIATTIIVGAFLFGLGIGSLIGASFADRLSLRGALRAFAFCGIAGVGVFRMFQPHRFLRFFSPELASLAGDPLTGSGVIILALFRQRLLWEYRYLCCPESSLTRSKVHRLALGGSTA